MQIIQSRRDFLASMSAVGAAGVLGAGGALADEPPPEVTTIRLRRDPSICVAPWYIAEDLLRAEGFTDVRYVPAQSGPMYVQMITRGELDFALSDAGSVVARLPGCRRAGNGAGGRACRMLRAVRARTHSHHQ
jgi:NitT/TauT family transport system substrate-binding protein